jgi:hypothetical protein
MSQERAAHVSDLAMPEEDMAFLLPVLSFLAKEVKP